MRTFEIIVLSATLAVAVAAPTPAQTDPPDVADQLEALRRENESLRAAVDALRQDVERARDDALAARDMAAAGPSASIAAVRAGYTPAPAQNDGAILSRDVGGVRVQLLDVSLDVLSAVGGSTASDDELLDLEAGGHDPRQRGFTLQNVELSLFGAVDPYFDGEAHLVYFIDPEGESQFEIEEAFATTQRLPFGLEERGFQLELGQFFTEFGRINPQHPHQWDWQDQPVIMSRVFGGDGMRAPGVRAGWLTPLPWYSEVFAGAQNAKGETMVSFLASDEVFDERPIGGRPFDDVSVNGPEDLVWLARWVNGFDVSDTLSAMVGASSVFGPNATGDDGHTVIAGGDLVVKWRPLRSNRGWPFVEWQSEFVYRHYDATSYSGCPEPEADEPCTAPVKLGSASLDDWGFYSQLLWGFRRGWAAGLRVEYASGSGSDVEFDADTNSFGSSPRNEDPFRDDRWRLSPLLVFYPSEFSRIRLQYNYDDARHLRGGDAHSLWAGLEFTFGAHGAHTY